LVRCDTGFVENLLQCQTEKECETKSTKSCGCGFRAVACKKEAKGAAV